MDKSVGSAEDIGTTKVTSKAESSHRKGTTEKDKQPLKQKVTNAGGGKGSFVQNVN